MLKTISSITNAIGALNFKGTWNAATNTPTIVSGVGVKGDYFVVSVAGSTTIDGISNWGVGDWITYNGSVWQRVEGGADLNGVNLSVSGTTTLSGLTASTALALDASKNVVSVTNTGTGNNVLATSPSLTTPILGAATATSINKVDLTAPATGSTLTIADGKTLTANHSLTLAGTDATTMTFPSTSATISRTDAAQTFTGNQTYAATLVKNQVNAGSSGTPANDVVLQYFNTANRCQLRAYNIAQNLTTRTWWSITATDDNGDQVEEMIWSVYSDIAAGNHFRPTANNTFTLGNGTFRWSEVYATNGVINTSDVNSKEQIESLSNAELRVAKVIKQSIKKFKYKDAVVKKGDGARIHVGVIAQEVKAAFEIEGLDAGRYGIFCEDIWYEIDGKAHSEGGPYYTENDPDAVKVVSLGIRYDQLLAFVVAAL